MAVQPIPSGYHTVTPYLICKNANKAIEFYKKAFGATELMRMPGPGGKIMHAELRIGDSPVMMADEFPEMGARSPITIGGTGVGLMIYVPDVDAQFKQAVSAGATVKAEVRDQFYGDRSGTVVDPDGHQWTVATHKEDVPHAELERRMKEMFNKPPA